MITPKAKISERQIGNEQGQRAHERNVNKKKGGTDSPGPVYGQKSQVPNQQEGRASKKRASKDKEAEVSKANKPPVETTWSHTKSQISKG